MKSKKQFIVEAVMSVLIMMAPAQAQAQQEDQSSRLSIGVDFYTNYIWRGTKFGTGPALQPTLKFTDGGLTIGAWGSFDAFGYAETDPYISYSFPFGLSLGVTDYYYPDLELFDISRATGSHALEINGGFTWKHFSLSANYIINEAGGAASTGGDKYFQIGYAFKNLSVFAGAGDGWHTSDDKFNLCNIGIGTSKEILITDNFSIPVNAQVIINPEREQLFVVAGFSF